MNGRTLSKWLWAVAVAALALGLFACAAPPPPSPELSPGNDTVEDTPDDSAHTLSVALVGRENPGLTSLTVELSRVEVYRTPSDGNPSGEWVLLTDEPQVIDVLTLTDGIEAILADATPDDGLYDKIRITIDNAWVTVYDVTYGMQILAGGHSIERPLESLEVGDAGAAEVVLDFDSLESVRLQPDGSFQFRPALDVVEWDRVGSLSGTVMPLLIGAEVSAYRKDNKMLVETAAVTLDGGYLLPRLRALDDNGKPVAYTLIASAEGYLSQSYQDVSVIPGVILSGYDFELNPADAPATRHGKH